MGDTKTEVWFRNPYNYIREILEVPEARWVIWDRGLAMKRQIDPQKHGNLYFGKNPDWRALVCGDQGCAEVNFEHGMENPVAVYPVWVYGEDDLNDLENMIVRPVGEDRAACSAQTARDETPVFGQEHRIIINGLNKINNQKSVKVLINNIREIQEEYEHKGSIIQVHGSYSYSSMFARGLGATDIDPRTDASMGRIVLPPGKKVTAERAHLVTHWINLLGMTPPEMKIPRNRCIFNIKSALWAGENWSTDLKFKTTTTVNLVPDSTRRASLGNGKTGRARAILGNLPVLPGDKVVCNSCSLAEKCKLYREDAVCTVPESEVSSLAEYFQSRDADTIIDALGTVLGAQAERLKRGVQMEEDFGELDPHVSKMLNDLFKNGKDLAKLIDPKLGASPVTVNVGAQAPVIEGGNMKGLMSKVVAAIQHETGLPVEEITNDLIVSKLAQMTNQSSIEQ